MRANKQHVFDDFAAAAEHLIASGWTSPDRLAVAGNGGLLVEGGLTQRPELFAAVACSAPLLDMVRYERFGLGETWNDEYGRADDPTELGWLVGYSPTTRSSRHGLPGGAVHRLRLRHPGGPAPRPQDVRRPPGRHHLRPPGPVPPRAPGRPRRPLGQPDRRAPRRHPDLPGRPARPGSHWPTAGRPGRSGTGVRRGSGAGRVDGGGEVGGEGRPARPASAKRSTRAVPTMTPSAKRATAAACSALETPMPAQTGRSVWARTRPTRSSIPAAAGSQAGHAEPRLGVDEAPTGLGDRGQAGVGGGGGGQEHRGDPGGGGRLQPSPPPRAAGRARPPRRRRRRPARPEPPWAAVGDQVVVDEQDHPSTPAVSSLTSPRTSSSRVPASRAAVTARWMIGPSISGSRVGRGRPRARRPRPRPWPGTPPATRPGREPGDPVGDQRRPPLHRSASSRPSSRSTSPWVPPRSRGGSRRGRRRRRG